MDSYTYNNNFFDYIEHGSYSSAQIILKLLLDNLSIQSVLDVGCGRGVWMKEWLKQGVSDVLGVDGDYISVETLAIPEKFFLPADLTKPLELNRKFDLVQSLEVAEHIPNQFSEIFVNSLIRHGSIILFSAAPPGQGGKFHVNEQEYGYWRDVFSKYNYHLIDFVRPIVNSDRRTQVEPWYKYNTMLFVHIDSVDSLPLNVQTTLVGKNSPVKDYAPLLWRARRFILKNLPQQVVAFLVELKHTLVLKIRSLKHFFASNSKRPL